MKLARVAIPVAATIAIVALGAFMVALVANGVLADEPPADAPASSTPVATSNSIPEPVPASEAATSQKDIELVLPEIPDKPREVAPQVQRTTQTQRTAPPAPAQGEEYTWEDGDRTLMVLLQEDLTVQKTSEISTTDVVVSRGALDSIVHRQAWHSTDEGPVFKSESGGGLMTLPGGVLLALDPDWDDSEVSGFFSQNGISEDDVSPLEFIANGFLVETDSGFPSLDLANDLASQDGVLISSPNWSREIEPK